MPIGDAAAFGSNVRVAIGKETTWGTGVAVTDIATFTAETLAKLTRFLQADYLDGQVGRTSVINSVIEATGDLSLEIVFDQVDTGDFFGWEGILLAALGSGTWDAANSVVKYEPADTLPSYTVAVEKGGVTVWEMQGAKVSSLTITGTVGGKITGTATLVGRNVLFTGDTGIVNSAAAINALASSNKPDLALMQDGVFRIGATGAALGASDQWSISEFTLTIDNQLTDPTFSTPDADHSDALFSIEPLRNGRRLIDFAFKAERYFSNQWFTWANANTAIQADLIISSGSDELNIYMPQCKFVEPPTAPTEGDGPIVVNGKVACLINGGSNTDMQWQDASNIDEELAIEIGSNRTAAP